MNCPISGNPCSGPSWWGCNRTLDDGSRVGCYEDACIKGADGRSKDWNDPRNWKDDYAWHGDVLYYQGVPSSNHGRPQDE